MKEIYVEVISTPVTDILETKSGQFLGKHSWYYAMWEGQKIIVSGDDAFSETLPSVGSKGLLSGNFCEQRFYDDHGKKIDMPYFFVEYYFER